MTKRRGCLPPKPEPPPEYMWWYCDVVPIAHVERRAQARMALFDRLPRKTRDTINYEIDEGGALSDHAQLEVQYQAAT
jgi:hypothetical protein